LAIPLSIQIGIIRLLELAFELKA